LAHIIKPLHALSTTATRQRTTAAAAFGRFLSKHHVTNIVVLKEANAKRWADAKPTGGFSSVARHLVAPDAKERYQAVSAKTGVPWAAIAVIN
jgi:putative SOS response-associated peptidase YedK